MVNKKVLKIIKKLPKVPGTYMFKNKQGEVIYVGKAKNLNNRVKSYFQNNLDVRTKTWQLVQNTHDINFIEVASEFEALILEASLISKFDPKYNIALKDDKSYLFIAIESEKVKKNGLEVVLPKLILERRIDLKKDMRSFGPFPESNTAKNVLYILRKNIGFRDCSPRKFQRYSKQNKPCLYGDLNLCQAPCLASTDASTYKRDVKNIEKLLSGKSGSLYKYYAVQMNKASKNQDFESAGQFKDILKKLDYIRINFKPAQSYLDNPYLIEDILDSSLFELVRNVPILKEKPERIECYDISNLSGKEATAAMIVATGGRIDKSEYKRFQIKLKDSPDDFEMLREVLRRRFSEKWLVPDLIVVDGGKGQVSASLEVLSEKNLKIPVIGIAKRYETLIYFHKGGFKEVSLDKNNEGLKLIQRIRDEAHRSSRKYHHLLRLKKLTS